MGDWNSCQPSTFTSPFVEGMFCKTSFCFNSFVPFDIMICKAFHTLNKKITWTGSRRGCTIQTTENRTFFHIGYSSHALSVWRSTHLLKNTFQFPWQSSVPTIALFTSVLNLQGFSSWNDDFFFLVISHLDSVSKIACEKGCVVNVFLSVLSWLL